MNWQEAGRRGERERPPHETHDLKPIFESSSSFSYAALDDADRRQHVAARQGTARQWRENCN